MPRLALTHLQKLVKNCSLHPAPCESHDKLRGIDPARRSSSVRPE